MIESEVKRRRRYLALKKYVYILTQSLKYIQLQWLCCFTVMIQSSKA